MKRILAIALALSLLACGCKSTGRNDLSFAENTSAESQTEETTNAQKAPLQVDALATDNTVVYADEVIDSELNLALLADGENSIYAANGLAVYQIRDGEIIPYLELPEAEWPEPQMTIEDMAVAGDVVWLKLCTNTPVDDGTVDSYSIQGYQNGELRYVSDDVTTMPRNQIDWSLIIEDIETDAPGNLYAVHDGFVRVMNPDGTALGDIPMDDMILSLHRGADGFIYVCTARDQENTIYRLDGNSLSAKPVADLNITEVSGNPDGEPLLYQHYGYAIYGLSAASLTWGVVADTSDLGLSMDDVSACIPDGNGGFYLYLVDALHHLTPGDGPANSEKTTLTLATCNADSYAELARVFNERSEDYTLVVQAYRPQSGNISEATDLLLSDLRAGNSPDLIDLAAFNREILAESGMLAELTPYLESDADYSASDFLMYDAMLYDGKLYQIPRDFSLEITYGDANYYGEDTTWSYADVLDVAKQYSALGIWGADQSETLRLLLRTYLPGHMDYAAGTCDFETEDFETILEIARTAQYDLTDEEANTGIETEIKTAFEAALADAENSPCRLQSVGFYDKTDFQTRMPELAGLVPVSLPTGDSSEYCIITLQRALGISSASQDQDAAWEVIHEMLSGQAQSLSMLKSEFDSMLDSLCHPTTSYAGKEIILNEDGTFYADGELYTETPYEESIAPYMTADQVEEINHIITHTAKFSFVDYRIVNVIAETASDYFAGNSTFSETAKMTQEQVLELLAQ